MAYSGALRVGYTFEYLYNVRLLPEQLENLAAGLPTLSTPRHSGMLNYLACTYQPVVNESFRADSRHNRRRTYPRTNARNSILKGPENVG